MGAKTKIEWCDKTFNPWIGCTKVGLGCDNCYAEADFDKRRHVVKWGAGQARHRTSAANWSQPLKWDRHAKLMQGAWDKGKAEFGLNDAELIERGFIKPPRPRVFCSSLADVFDNEVDPQWRVDLFELIRSTPNLSWLLLTKRVGNVTKMLHEALRSGRASVDLWAWLNDWIVNGNPPENVWLGATVVNQTEADRDIPKLLAIPARIRFLSIEPMLGAINLEQPCDIAERVMCAGNWSDMEDTDRCLLAHRYGSVKLLDWVIVGGESGPNARPMHPQWARSLRDQCVAAGVAFFYKQYGEFKSVYDMSDAEIDACYWPAPDEQPEATRRRKVYSEVLHIDGSRHELKFDSFGEGSGAMQMFRVGKKSAGRLLDGVEHNGVPV